MSTNFKSAINVMLSAKMEQAITWYSNLLQRKPDVEPAPGVAEWELVGTAWLQLSEEPQRAGHGSLIITVNSLDEQIQLCKKLELEIGEIIEIPEVIKMFELKDLDGNSLNFVEEI